MSSKNNPENRGQVTEMRVYNGKKVKPVLFINRNRRYIAARRSGHGPGQKDPDPLSAGLIHVPE